MLMRYARCARSPHANLMGVAFDGAMLCCGKQGGGRALMRIWYPGLQHLACSAVRLQGGLVWGPAHACLGEAPPVTAARRRHGHTACSHAACSLRPSQSTRTMPAQQMSTCATKR